jgi:membrane associated rhomboid family serine protease
VDYFSDSFSLVPSRFLYAPWTLFTAVYVQSTPIQFIFNCVTFYLSSTYFERNWGTNELSKQFLIASVGTNILVALVYILRYALIQGYEELFMPINGLTGFLAGLGIAYKRVMLD